MRGGGTVATLAAVIGGDVGEHRLDVLAATGVGLEAACTALGLSAHTPKGISQCHPASQMARSAGFISDGY